MLYLSHLNWVKSWINRLKAEDVLGYVDLATTTALLFVIEFVENN